MLVSVSRATENTIRNDAISSGPPRTAPLMVRIGGVLSTSANSTHTVLFVALEVLSIIRFSGLYSAALAPDVFAGDTTR